MSESMPWPPRPYKGLSYYGPDDAPLFAGRDADVERFARIIAESTTRIAILHGATGSGKSSFLRAGLIPFIERRGRGFGFLKSDDSRAIFVRSTAAPLASLADEMTAFASRERRVQTPLGEQVIRIAIDDAWRRSPNDAPQQLVRALERIADALTETLIVVIDQAEEVLTLNAGAEGRENREAFFRFVAEFSRSTFDLKLLIAIRTEYYGRYRHGIQQVDGDLDAVDEFYLDELTDEQLIAAITRPTLDLDLEGMGSPRETYQFVFEKGLPQTIVADLREANITGGILPVTQIICEALYDMTLLRERMTSRMIRVSDYRSLGTLEDQVDRHLEAVLTKWCAARGVRKVEAEIDGWRTVLAELAHTQVDGTVTTELKPAEDLKKVAKKVKTQLPFDATMRHLQHEEQRIVRPVTVATLTSDDPILCYSLGHDVLGLPLIAWTRSEKRGRESLWGIKKVLIGYGVAILAIGGFIAWRSPEKLADIYVPLSMGVTFLLFAALLKRNPAEHLAFPLFRSMWPGLGPEFQKSLLGNGRFARYLRAHPPLPAADRFTRIVLKMIVPSRWRRITPQ